MSLGQWWSYEGFQGVGLERFADLGIGCHVDTNTGHRSGVGVSVVFWMRCFVCDAVHGTGISI